MPSYFYHLRFELYPYRTPYESKPQTQEVEREDGWIPPPGTDIFDTRDWPRHQRRSEEEGEKEIQLDRKEREYLAGISKTRVLNGAADAGGGVIDCGPSRGSSTNTGKGNDTEPSPPTRSSADKPDYPHPRPSLETRDQRIAVKDYRFGLLSVESVDMVDKGQMDGRPGVRRGESSMSIADAGNGINAHLAPGASLGRVTKARFEALEGKNTEIGWGIVHLYRDGEETFGLNGPGAEANNGQTYSVAAGGALAAVEEEKEKGAEEEQDCTTLCIPAVPSYLTFNDFLGFVGEKTWEEVSHFRMVMTARTNRYLVLMKFRNSGAARRWRAEWDGKVFYEMEVRSPEVSHSLVHSKANL
jgi:BRCA1-associated protein